MCLLLGAVPPPPTHPSSTARAHLRRAHVLTRTRTGARSHGEVELGPDVVDGALDGRPVRARVEPQVAVEELGEQVLLRGGSQQKARRERAAKAPDAACLCVCVCVCVFGYARARA